MFSNLVLCGKLYESVRFVCEQETWEFLQPNELSWDERCVINETITYVLAGKYLHDSLPLFYVGGIRLNTYFYSCVH